ncbi:hypothetical protein EDB85DRAFT_2002696 [Lactarius pseudohatsudake]|nr:hypothetical protein EDB85DRAFT_2002696 [Lactarius pseudohatsudake]
MPSLTIGKQISTQRFDDTLLHRLLKSTLSSYLQALLWLLMWFSSVKSTSAQTRSCLNYSEKRYSPSILYSYWS